MKSPEKTESIEAGMGRFQVKNPCQIQPQPAEDNVAAETAQLETPSIDPDVRAINLRTMKLFSAGLMPAIAVAALAIASVSLYVFAFIFSGEKNDAWSQVLAIHLVQISVGLILGLLCLFLGAMMCWFGVSGTYNVGMEGGGAKLNIQGAQMGLVLLVGGMLLTAVSLHKSLSLDQKPDWKGETGGSIALHTATRADSAAASLVPSVPPADAVRSLALMREAEAVALQGAVNAAELAAKNVDDAAQRGAAFQVVNAIKDFARQRSATPAN